jgi:hypothetical protein
MNQSHDKSKKKWIVWYSVVSALGNVIVVVVISNLVIVPVARTLYISALNSVGSWFVISAIPLAIEAVIAARNKKKEDSPRNAWALAGVLFVTSYGLYLALTLGATSLIRAEFRLGGL